MTGTPLIWSAALAVSLTAHVAAAAALVWATRPGDVPVQQPPETELQLAAYQVPRSEAREATPDAQDAVSGDTGGARADQGAIATSRSEAQTIEGARIAPEPDTGVSVSPAPPPSQTLSGEVPVGSAATGMAPAGAAIAAEAPPADALSAGDATPVPARPVTMPAVTAPRLAASAATIAAQPTEAPGLTAQTLSGDALAALVTPAVSAQPIRPRAENAPAPRIDNTKTAPVDPDIPAASPAALDSAPVGESPATGQSAPPLRPPAERARASLAFAAAGDGPVDPVSLTAFQSFMTPGDPGSQAAEVRDGIASTLSSVPCSRLQIRYDPEENVVLMTGHVPEDGLRNSVLAAMQDKMGADIPVREDLLVLPRPQCGALSGIAQVGLPQSTDQITNPLLLGENTHAREFTYVDGQPLVLDLQGADYDAYVYVDFFDAGGNVLHLRPNEFTPMELTAVNSSLTIGSDRELSPGEPGLYIRIGPPYGQEIAVAFAASDPLYEGVRPLMEPAEPYLDWLRVRVADARERNPDFKGEWVYFFVSTAAE